METQPTLEHRARRILSDVALCLGKIAGKYAAFPNVDSATCDRVTQAIENGWLQDQSTSRMADACQELRAVASCDLRELLRFPGADDSDIRIAAILEVVRSRARLEDSLFREVLTAHLSWEKGDKAVILDALTRIIRG